VQKTTFSKFTLLKGAALNPNSLNLTVNREKILLQIRFGTIS